MTDGFFFVNLSMDLHEALFWIANKNHVTCQLCPNYCRLEDGQIGSCNARINKGNTLYTLAYNNPTAINIDPIEKKPLYHFLPGHSTFSLATNGCVLHCVQCQNSAISQCRPSEKAEEAYSPKNIAKMAVKYNCDSISLTYTDPVAFYEYGSDICREANIKELPVTYISSGYINHEPLKMIAPHISAANIDLKSFNNNTYKHFFKGQLSPVLDTILYLFKQKVWLEITVLLIPGINDSDEELSKLTLWMKENGLNNVPLHFSKFHPSHKLLSKPITSIQTLENAKNIAVQNGIKFCYIGNSDEKKYHTTYCTNCGKTLIERHRLNLSYIFMNGGKCPECDTLIPGIW